MLTIRVSSCSSLRCFADEIWSIVGRLSGPNVQLSSDTTFKSSSNVAGTQYKCPNVLSISPPWVLKNRPTRIQISGRRLGLSTADIKSVTICGVACTDIDLKISKRTPLKDSVRARSLWFILPAWRVLSFSVLACVASLSGFCLSR
jgi:hypothetical protein